MDGIAHDTLSRHPAPLRRLTTAEYYRMGEVGILGENDRVELIEGQLVALSPVGVRHALAVDALAEQFVLGTNGRAAVRVQNPISLEDGTEPQPDVVLARRGWHGYPLQHPSPPDVLLVVEVSDSSLRFDTAGKREIYARSGIPEYWVVDLVKSLVHVHREPGGDGYRTQTLRDASAELDVQSLPDMIIPAASLFA